MNNNQRNTLLPALAPWRLPLLVGLAVISLCGCEEPAQEAKPLQPMEVTAYTVKAKDAPIAFEFVGKTASSRKVEIRSRVEGFLEQRLYTEGSRVESGKVLFQMDRKPFEAKLQAAQAELAQQDARKKTAATNLNRVRPLAKKNAVAQKELDDALGGYQTAAAAVEAAKANVVQAELNLGYTTILSPVSGVSSFAVQQEGAYIGTGTGSLLTYVAQVDPMWVEFSVSENQILRFRDDDEGGQLKFPEHGNFDVEILLADGSVYPHEGKITFSDASISEETGTFLIRAEVINPDDALRPGQFVRARLKGAIRPNAILVPKRAVLQGAKGSFVWVIGEAGKVDFRPVTAAAWQEDRWFITDGLQDGETVVVDGAQKLQSGISVSVAPEENSADKPGKS